MLVVGFGIGLLLSFNDYQVIKIGLERKEGPLQFFQLISLLTSNP